MISRAVDYFKRVFFISPCVPKHVDIEVSTSCNLHCSMCKREELDFGNKLMPFEAFKKIVDALPKGVELLSFGGYGEMMIHPRFFEMVRYAKDRGFMTETTSNGTLLATDERMVKLLECGLDSFRISIDHVRAPECEPEVGHMFSERVLKDVKRLSELRREKNSSMQLGINTVVHKGNVDEVLDIIKLADRLGFDLVELIRLDTCLNRAERTLQFESEKALYDEVKRMDKKVRVITPANRFSKWRRLYNRGRGFCPFRFESAHIRLNGAVTPCAFGFAVHDFGNIHKGELRDIWQSDKFSRIRQDHDNSVCRNCSIFKWEELSGKSGLIEIGR